MQFECHLMSGQIQRGAILQFLENFHVAVEVFKLAMEAGSKKVWGTKRRRPPVIYADSDLDEAFSNDSDSSAIEVMKSSPSPHRVLDNDEENPQYENLAPPEIFPDGKVYFYNILRQQVSERMPELEPDGVEAAITRGWEALPLEKKQYYSDLSQVKYS